MSLSGDAWSREPEAVSVVEIPGSWELQSHGPSVKKNLSEQEPIKISKVIGQIFSFRSCCLMNIDTSAEVLGFLFKRQSFILWSTGKKDQKIVESSNLLLVAAEDLSGGRRVTLFLIGFCAEGYLQASFVQTNDHQPSSHVTHFFLGKAMFCLGTLSLQHQASLTW